MAVYPDDATYNTVDFVPLASPVTYTSTGSETTFPLSAPVEHKGQVLVIEDGLLTPTTSYELLSNNHAITFLTAPNANVLILRNVNIPRILKKEITTPEITLSEYFNDSITDINGNSYLIDGSNTSWAFGASASGIASKDQILVAVDEQVIQSSEFTFPSSTLGNSGIDITPALDSSIASMSIRVLESPGTAESLISTCRGIIDRKPANGFSTDINIENVTFRSQSGYSKSRLISRRPRRKWTLQYVNVTGIDVDSIEEFYNNRFGMHETFVFDLTHINKSGTTFVKFAQPIRITFKQSLGTDEADVYYDVDVIFEEVDN